MATITWIASYPKSGNTWVRAFIYNLLHPSTRAASLERLPDFFQGELKQRWYAPHAGGRSPATLGPEDTFSMRRRVHRAIAQSGPGTVFAKTHSPYGSYNGIPLQEASVIAGAIYVVRNPLDVVISVADHFGLDLDQAIDFLAEEQNATRADDSNVMDFISSWSVNVQTWTAQAHPKLCVVRYEDMVSKPEKTFRKIASFLGHGQDKRRIQQAIRHSSFDELSRQESQDGFSERSPHSQRFFRKGSSRQWKDVLSSEQRDRIIARHAEQMQRYRYLPAIHR